MVRQGRSGWLLLLLLLLLGAMMPARAQGTLPALPYARDAVFAADNAALTVAWSDGSVTREGTQGHQLLLPATTGIRDVMLAPGGTRVLLKADREVRVIDLVTRRVLFTHTLPAEPAASLLLSPDGTRLAVAYDATRPTELFDVDTGRLLASLPGDFKDGGFLGPYLVLIRDQSLNGPGDTLIVADHDGRQLLSRLFESIYEVGIVPTKPGELLVAGYKGVQIVDVARGEMVRSYKPFAVPRTFVPLPGGNVASYNGGGWEIVDPRTGQRKWSAGQLQDGGDIHEIAAGPAGKLVLWVDFERLVIADPATGATRTLIDYGDDGRWLAASPDGRRVAIGVDRSLRILDLSGRALAQRCIEPPGGQHRCALADARIASGTLDIAPADAIRKLIGALQREDTRRWDSERSDGYDYLKAADRLAELDLDREAEAAYRWIIGAPGTRMLPAATLAFADLLQRQRRHGEAIALLQPLAGELDARPRVPGFPQSLYANVLAALSEAQLETGQTALAVATAQRAYQAYGITASFSGRYIGRALLVQAKGLTRLGRLEEAQALRLDLLRQLRARHNESALAVETRIGLGEGYAATGAYAQGDALILDAIQILRRALGDGNPLTIDARERLARLRLQARQPAAALDPIRAAARALTGADQVRLDRYRPLFRLQVTAAWQAQPGTVAPRPAQSPAVAAVATSPTSLTAHEKDVRVVAISPDGRFVVTGSLDRTLRVWDARTGVQLRMIGTSGTVETIRFIDPTRMLVLAYNAFTYDAATGERVPIGRDDIAHAVVRADDGTIAVSSDRSTEIFRPDGTTLSIREEGDEIWEIALSPDGTRLAGRLMESDRVGLWDAVTGRRIAILGKSNAAPAFLGGIVHVVSSDALSERPVQRYDMATGRQLAPGENPNCSVFDLEAVAGVLLARGRRACLFEPGNPVARTFFTYGGQAFVYRATLSPDRRLAALGLNNGQILLVDVAAGKLLATLDGHADAISSLVFSTDGATLVSGSRDRAARVWDTRTGEARLILGDE